MTKALPFTEASLARAIRGVERAGKHVVQVRADGTLIVADKPLDPASLAPPEMEQSPARKTMGDYINGRKDDA